jgi:predicted TIM-barrel fold metal-dependent hydrolase
MVLWAGVFERHPKLKFVLTEQGAGWIPAALAQLDGMYTSAKHPQFREGLSLKPSEYWARQCYSGASFLSRLECEMRHAIGPDRMMWGSDYPHLEGTWPHTAERVRETFAGVPEPEVRMMMGETAAKVYNFDLNKLRSVAERVGPTVDAVAGVTA